MYDIKFRADTKPIPIIIHKDYDISQIAERVSEVTERLISTFWPGPLTLIFMAKPNIKYVNHLSTIAIRKPNHSELDNLLSRFGFPLAVISANISGEEPCLTAATVFKTFNGLIPLILNSSLVCEKIPSTIVDVSKKKISILRISSISELEILECLKRTNL